jgi:hypothetical protein
MIRDLILSASESRKWWLAGGIHPSQVVAAYQPKGAVDLAASYVNLANPGTYDAIPIAAPTLSDNGWLGSGDAALNTGIVPGTRVTIIIRLMSDNNLNGASMVVRKYGDETKRIAAIIRYNNSDYCAVGSNPAIDKTIVHSGVVCIAMNNGVVDYVFLNGSKTKSHAYDSSIVYQQIPLLAEINNSGSYVNNFHGTIVGAAIYNVGLSEVRYDAVIAALKSI